MKIRFQNSNIDWNEIYPHFSADLKDLMWEEAKPLLAGGHVIGNGEAPYTKRMSMGARRAQQRRREHKLMRGVRRRRNGSPPVRRWTLDYPGQRLAVAGRRFKINKTLVTRVQEQSGFGIVWRHLQASKADVISTEGLMALAKGAKINGGVTMANLYARCMIDPVATEAAKPAPATGSTFNANAKAN